MREFTFQAPVKICFGEDGVEMHLVNLLENVGVTSEYLGYPVTFAVSAVVIWLGLTICLKTYRKK